MPTELQLGYDALIFTGLYLCLMLALGYAGRRSRREESLRDFYLAGPGFGFVVLFLTFFATQYSGNTLLGFAGRAYAQGATYIVSVTFMILVVTVLAVYAPRLYRLSRTFGYLTPADYVYHRFGSHWLRVLAVLLLSWGLANYVLEQLVAMGRGVEALSEGKLTSLIVAACRGLGFESLVEGVQPGGLDFMTGVLVLAFVMLLYESLGGMRAVAWTDVVQGVLLFAGCACILVILVTQQGGLGAATAAIRDTAAPKLQVPDAGGLRTWVSNLVLLGFGIAVYPHAVQRIFAARNVLTLRRSLAVMVFMPLLTTFLAFLIGYVGLSQYPDLARADSDKITVYVLMNLGKSMFHYWLVVVVLTAVVAAIMSTADSALLTMSSMFVEDIYKPYLKPDASAHHSLMVGKAFAWLVMVVLISGAYVSLRTESSIWLLIKLKLEFMVQIVPLFLLGIHVRRLPAWAVLAGMAGGTLITLAVWGGAIVGSWEGRSPYGVSAGVWGLLLNFGICLFGILVSRERPRGVAP